MHRFLRSFNLLVILGLSLAVAKAATTSTKKPSTTRKPAARSASYSASKAPTAKKASISSRRRTSRYSPYKEPTLADSTLGDVADGEDLVVRRAAAEALGAYNGTVVVVDPNTGRILSIINQKLAFKSGFQPCSTIKIVCALAGLSERIIDRNTHLRAGGRLTMTLTEALAHSNNPYFANLGTKLGFDRVRHYGRLYGLGEKAGLNISEERPGLLPAEAPQFGGVGMMTSFGEGILLTPLELAALLSSIANGGTLYYLQYPRTQEEVANFVPRVKRQLDIQQWIPEVKPGMMGAVEFGTGRRAFYDPNEPILGKTGTCTDKQTPTHLGWFGSFNDVGRNKLVVVVLLTGGKSVNGPVASQVAGGVYKQLSGKNFFAQARPISPAALASTQSCCAQ